MQKYHCAAAGVKEPPPCVLCPVVGGALKPTAEGAWCHVACALWTPETHVACTPCGRPVGPIQGIAQVCVTSPTVLLLAHEPACLICKPC